MDVSKAIVVDLHNGDKLTDKNYDVWRGKMEDVLKDREVLETVTRVTESPRNDDVPRSNMETYISFKEKERIARILILSSMRNDLMLRFEKHKSPKSLWDDVKLQLGGTPATRRRQLMLNFNLFKKLPHTTMEEHLATMSNMIKELWRNGQALSDEEQVLAVIRSLPPSWENIRTSLTQDDNIRNFDDVSKHLVLHKDYVLNEKPKHERNNVSRDNKRKREGKEKGQGSGKAQDCTNKRINPNKKVPNKAEMECYRCKKLGHFARECIEQEVETSTQRKGVHMDIDTFIDIM
ncbi:hypothetical protein ACHQM5_004455 [Ranunculus cassubicifolius]